MDYPTLKLIHLSAIACSGLGFTIRGVASLRGAPWLQGRRAKTVPHVVDTVLLLSALALAVQLQLNPAHTPWLLAKLIGLALYIALGMVALRPRFSLAVRSGAWVLALGVFAWIASVAITKSPLGFFSCLALR